LKSEKVERGQFGGYLTAEAKTRYTEIMDYELIIIGGGPAGLTAAIYAGRAKLKTLLLDKEIPGGQLNDTTEVENYPGFIEPIPGPELMERMRKQAERFGIEIKLEEVLDVGFSTEALKKPLHTVITDEGRYKAPVVIIATGAAPVELPAKGADKLKGRGLSYCATCDGYFHQGKNVLQIGAGDSGFTEALFLTRFANEIRMIVRHPKGDHKAIKAKDAMLVEKVMSHPKVKFLWNTRVVEILGEQKVEGVVLEELSTKRKIVMDDISGVFVAIGHRPATGFLRGKLEMDERGYICTDASCRTKIPGVFAVGDVRWFSGQYAQAVIAAGDGCIAALEAEEYLESGQWQFAS